MNIFYKVIICLGVLVLALCKAFKLGFDKAVLNSLKSKETDNERLKKIKSDSVGKSRKQLLDDIKN